MKEKNGSKKSSLTSEKQLVAREVAPAPAPAPAPTPAPTPPPAPAPPPAPPPTNIGYKLTYNSWATGEPNNSGGSCNGSVGFVAENAVEMSSGSGEWNDVSGLEKRFSYVKYYGIRDTLSNFSYLGQYKEYSYFKNPAQLTWEDAKIAAENVGGYLSFHHTEDENSEVANFSNDNDNFDAWIGLYKDKSGSCGPNDGWKWLGHIPGELCKEAIVVEPGNYHNVNLSTKALWYTYTADANGTININYCNNGQSKELNTGVRVHTGICNELIIIAYADGTGISSPCSGLEDITVTQDKTYLIEWYPLDTSSGDTVFSWELAFTPTSDGTAENNAIKMWKLFIIIIIMFVVCRFSLFLINSYRNESLTKNRKKSRLVSSIKKSRLVSSIKKSRLVSSIKKSKLYGAMSNILRKLKKK